MNNVLVVSRNSKLWSIIHDSTSFSVQEKIITNIYIVLRENITDNILLNIKHEVMNE